MAGSTGPGETGPDGRRGHSERDQDLERRRRELDASLASRRRDRQAAEEDAGRPAVSGYGQAFRLSSEFIAGIAVGAGLGWVIDRYAGTSPWGLIVFLLLGFAAGVLNVLRSAGMIAEAGSKSPERRVGKPDRE